VPPRIRHKIADTTMALRSRPPNIALVGSGVPFNRFSVPMSRRLVSVIAKFVNVALITPKHMIPGM
jgi:hypothetical protein